MKKTTKITLLVALCLVVAGCATSIVAFALGGSFEESTREVKHPIEGEFVSIDIGVAEADVRLEVSEDGTGYAVCDESDRIAYAVEVRDGTLLLRDSHDRPWYERFGISTGRSCRVTLYLPKGAYDRLSIGTSGGDILSEEVGLSFTHATLASGSGRISFTSPVRGELTASTSSGDIALSDMTLTALTATTGSGKLSLADLTADSVQASTGSGRLALSYVRADEMNLETSSGAVTLYHAFAEKKLQAVTSSGDVRLDRCDAGELHLQTSSGSIEGTLLSDKLFDARTNSGSINCPPPAANGGKCTVRTSSGDIDIQITD